MAYLQARSGPARATSGRTAANGLRETRRSRATFVPMEPRRRRSYGRVMNTILIGVDGSERSEDAIAFGGRIAAASGAQVIVACAFPYARAHGYATLRDAALDTAHAMSRKLEGVPARQVSIRAPAASPAQGLHELRSRRTPRSSSSARPTPATSAACTPAAPARSSCTARHARWRSSRAGTTSSRRRALGVAYDGSGEAKAALDSAVDARRAPSAPSSS